MGPLALTILTALYHWVFFRRALADGQYALVVFVTVPVGAILGGITGVVLAHLASGMPNEARQIALFGGGGLASLFLLLGWFVFSGTEIPTLRQRLSATLFWFGVPLAWSFLLVLAALAISFRTS